MHQEDATKLLIEFMQNPDYGDLGTSYGYGIISFANPSQNNCQQALTKDLFGVILFIGKQYMDRCITNEQLKGVAVMSVTLEENRLACELEKTNKRGVVDQEVIKIRRPSARVIDIRCNTPEQADFLEYVLRHLSGMYFEHSYGAITTKEEKLLTESEFDC